MQKYVTGRYKEQTKKITVKCKSNNLKEHRESFLNFHNQQGFIDENEERINSVKVLVQILNYKQDIVLDDFKLLVSLIAKEFNNELAIKRIHYVIHYIANKEKLTNVISFLNKHDTFDISQKQIEQVQKSENDKDALRRLFREKQDKSDTPLSLSEIIENNKQFSLSDLIPNTLIKRNIRK